MSSATGSRKASRITPISDSPIDSRSWSNNRAFLSFTRDAILLVNFVAIVA